MPSDILFKKNKNGGGLFDFKLPFTGKVTKKDNLKTSIESSVTYGSAKSGFIGATKCGHLDKQRIHSLKDKK